MKRYSVRVNRKDGSHKYIQWCDECWYETTVISEPKFSYPEAKRICEQMKNHYQYSLTIICEDGTTEEVRHLSSARKLLEKFTASDAPVKKSLFKLNMAVMKKK